MNKIILAVAATFLLPQGFVLADEMDHVINARVDAMREARNSAIHLQREIQTTGSNTGPSSKPINLAKPTVGTAVEPTIVNRVLKEPAVSVQKETTNRAATNVLTVQQQLKTTVDPATRVALQNQLRTNLVALNTEKENLRRTLIAEIRKEISKASKTRSPR